MEVQAATSPQAITTPTCRNLPIIRQNYPSRGQGVPLPLCRPETKEVEMSAQPEQFDLSHITPEQFAALIAGSDDDLILRSVRETGTRPVLERVFQGMKDRFLPEKAQKA